VAFNLRSAELKLRVLHSRPSVALNLPAPYSLLSAELRPPGLRPPGLRLQGLCLLVGFNLLAHNRHWEAVSLIGPQPEDSLINPVVESPIFRTDRRAEIQISYRRRPVIRLHVLLMLLDRVQMDPCPKSLCQNNVL
jgi:hypothetical protein